MEWVGQLITGTSSIIVAVITVWVKSRIDASREDKKKHEDERVKTEDLGEMIYINDFLDEIRTSYNFDRVSICQFHNGGKFFNGKSMKKFSMTYETTAPGIEKIKRNYQNILVSEFPRLFSALLQTDFIKIYDDTLEFPQLKREMQNNGITLAIKIAIRGLKGDLVGFITCHMIGDLVNHIENYHAEDFTDKANKISGYLLK